MPTLLEEYHRLSPEHKLQVLNDPKMREMLTKDLSMDMGGYLNHVANKEHKDNKIEGLKGGLKGSAIGAGLGALTAAFSKNKNVWPQRALAGLAIGGILGGAKRIAESAEHNDIINEAKYHNTRDPETKGAFLKDNANAWVNNQLTHLTQQFYDGFQKRADALDREGRELSANELIASQMEQKRVKKHQA